MCTNLTKKASLKPARVKHSKVWARVPKLSNASIRCIICSSVIVNRGNTSNIMKHLQTSPVRNETETRSQTPRSSLFTIEIDVWEDDP